MWTKACQNLGYQFVKKDTEEYKLVKEEYNRLKNEVIPVDNPILERH
jgi:hypothetical protein